MPSNAVASDQQQEFGPWDPGIESSLPREFLPLATVFAPENSLSNLRDLEETNKFCGLPIEKLATFRPERLALHEVLVRVMSDLSVPDGEKYEDLGVNFRRMTSAIMNKHIMTELPEIDHQYNTISRLASDFLERVQSEFSSAIEAGNSAGQGARPRLWSRLISRGREKAAMPTKRQFAERDLRKIEYWRSKAGSSSEPLQRSCYQSLAIAAEALFAKHGRLFPDSRLVTSVALRLACNDCGSEVIGKFLDPVFQRAVTSEGFRLLPSQSNPIVMNVKGASASGKSTMRPLQKKLAARLGIDWADFALISPDIWRKYLLDYSSLGAARRYAGTLTGTEVAIIDQKLDRYMSFKGKTGQLPHLLIDRFRFDSFAQEAGELEGGRLLTRFGTDVFLFFMVTPPEATVERAWWRGEQFGRYKAVDDLLAHNVEAYTGIPGLFFTWALRNDKRVHFEFLDNSVAEGQRPRTIAFGLNGRMNILDLNGLLDIDRFRNINIEARTPAEIYATPTPGDTRNQSRFLKDCVRRISIVNFADRDTGQLYARTKNGKLTMWRREIFCAAVHDERARAAFQAVVAPLRTDSVSGIDDDIRLDPRHSQTLGQWGKDILPQ
jgi:hypothetical protein